MLKSENIQNNSNSPPSTNEVQAQNNVSQKNQQVEKSSSKPFSEELKELSDKKNNKISAQLKDEEREQNFVEKLSGKNKGEAQDDLNQWDALFKQSDLQAQWIAALYTKAPELQPAEANSLLQTNSTKLTSADYMNLSSNSEYLSNEPLINLDKENMKMKIDFPMLSDLKSVSVQYDPNTRSIAAEMVTSREAAAVLQNQVAELERNLAKHNIKLESLKVTAAGANDYNQSKQQNQRERRSQKEYS